MGWETLLLGMMGMGGVFSGLTLLTLSLVGLRKTVSWMGLDEDGRGREEEPAPSPAPAPASPAPAPDAPAAPPIESTAATAGFSGPWRLASGTLAGPGAADWIRPAFRAAFRPPTEAAASGAETAMRVNGRDFAVRFLSLKGSIARMRVNGKDILVDLEDLPEGAALTAAPLPAAPPPAAAPTPAAPPPAPSKASAPKPPPPKPSAPAAAPPAAADGHLPVAAPIPGVVKTVNVKEGEAVKKDQVLFILEAMKMENEISSPAAGRMKEVRVQARDGVKQGQVLGRVTPE